MHTRGKNMDSAIRNTVLKCWQWKKRWIEKEEGL
jgi:hypothetical protein